MVGRQIHTVEQRMLGIRDENVSINRDGFKHDAQQMMFGTIDGGSRHCTVIRWSFDGSPSRARGSSCRATSL